MPFGEEVWANTAGRDGSFSSPDDIDPKFTGQGRDGETQLDWFQTRYFKGALGRFTSPDDPLVDQDPLNPQSWNLYSYARNNPTSNTDPTGKACVYSGSGDTNDSNSYSDDNSGGQNCSDAFGSPTPFSTTTTATVPYQLGEQAFVGFYNLFSNGQLSGASDLALGLFDLYPSNLVFSVTRTLCDSCANAVAAASIVRPTGVYRALTGNQAVQYIGITRQFLRRQVQQAPRFVIEEIPYLKNLSPADARAVEQALIENYGLQKQGGSLLNKINSIAVTNPIYPTSIERGRQILRNIGYPGF